MLTPKQARFVEEYLKDLNATQAAARAGYSAKTANEQGARLLVNVSVAAAIAERQADRAERLELEAATFLRELAALCLVDIADAYDAHGNLLPIRQMPRSVRRAIVGVDTVIRNAKAGDGITDTVQKIKLADKRGSLELMLRHLGLLVDRKEVGQPGDFRRLSDADLERELEAAHHELGKLLAFKKRA